ncbi:DUF4446 family protein [Paenibacillus hamazuiensis]|uniref:DUF4446 family protein n=1 Tax=Paenibacillus hamazuiensis TaxID=2936508 RepID=UPI00200C2924|nr:DUF4446 family protein [Paenibacillus hamazuiensis]
MGEIMELLPLDLIAVLSFILSIILLVLVISLWVKLSRLRAAYVKMINGGSPQNVEEILIALQQKLQDQEDKQKKNRESIQEITGAMKKMKSQIGIHRYNAFGEGGSDLSFSLAIVDEQQSGVVITGIHNREQVYVYAKPVEAGQSKYTLSPEEKEALIRSSQKE